MGSCRPHYSDVVQAVVVGADLPAFRECFTIRLSRAHVVTAQIFLEIWAACIELSNRNLGSPGAKLWDLAMVDPISQLNMGSLENDLER